MKVHFFERYVKLLLCGFALHDGEIYVKESFLNFLEFNSVRSMISKSKKAKNGRWIPHQENGFMYILLNSIPEFTREKLNLNFGQDYLKDLLVTHGGYTDVKILDQVKAESFLMIQKEIANYKKYLPTFYELYPTQDERVTQAINCAILNVIISFVKKYPRGLIDHFFDILKSDKITNHSIPIESANYFHKYINRVKRTGLPEALINGNRGKPSNNLRLTDTLKKLIIWLKTFGNFTSCREIEESLKKLRTKEEIGKQIKQVDESTIRNFLATDEAENSTLLVREGYHRFESQILGYLPLNRTKDPLTKILIDGYVIQVVCEGDDSLPTKLVMFTIMDSFSGFVVMEIGDVEDYKLISRCFEKFLAFTQYKMPKEIISDMHSSIQSEHFKSFRSFLADNGAKWHASPNPKRKAQLERWFGTLQQVYLSRIIGYVGEGIKSKRKHARPSEEVQFIIRKKEFLKDKNELIRIVLSAGDDYNKNAHFSNAASPLDLYHLKKPVHYLQLQDYHAPFFFWDLHQVSIQGSMVIIRKTINGKVHKWFYGNKDLDFALRNSEKVDAYHNPNDDQFAYLFEKGSNKFIRSIRKLLVANEAEMDQTSEDKKIIADFGISKAKLHQAFIDRHEEIETNLVAKFGVTTDELLNIATRKKESDEYDGYRAGIASKKPEPDLKKPYKLRKGRRAVKNNKTSRNDNRSFTIQDTMG